MLAIEHHPKNGHSPWVVVSRGPVRLWFAYRSRQEAEKKLTDLPFVGFVSSLQRLKGANDD